MDNLPTDICKYILKYVDGSDYSTWCCLSSRYYIIFHDYIRRHVPLTRKIVNRLCANGNIEYLRYIIQNSCDQYILYSTDITPAHRPAIFHNTNYCISDEISCAVWYKNISIVNYLTSLLPNGVIIIVDVGNSIEIIPQLLDNRHLIVIGISTAITHSLTRINNWDNNIELMIMILDWIEQIKMHPRLPSNELVPVAITESSIRTIIKTRLR